MEKFRIVDNPFLEIWDGLTRFDLLEVAVGSHRLLHVGHLVNTKGAISSLLVGNCSDKGDADKSDQGRHY